MALRQTPPLAKDWEMTINESQQSLNALGILWSTAGVTTELKEGSERSQKQHSRVSCPVHGRSQLPRGVMPQILDRFGHGFRSWELSGRSRAHC
jgi:hypothetical protein